MLSLRLPRIREVACAKESPLSPLAPATASSKTSTTAPGKASAAATATAVAANIATTAASAIRTIVAAALRTHIAGCAIALERVHRSAIELAPVG